MDENNGVYQVHLERKEKKSIDMIQSCVGLFDKKRDVLSVGVTLVAAAAVIMVRHIFKEPPRLLS